MFMLEDYLKELEKCGWTVCREQTYDPERYELVEKREWKINDLKERLCRIKTVFKANGEEITRLQKLENEYAKEMVELEKELKQLETKK